MPRPESLSFDDDAALLRWLTAFPSYGFLLSVRPQHVKPVLARFHARDIACAVVGQVRAWVRRDCQLDAARRGAEESLAYLRTVHHVDRYGDARVQAWEERSIRAASQVLCVSA